MRKDTLATRRLIIDAAEKLFAEQGVDGTSLLEIAQAAGQRNRSALQYHFTNKEGLLDAVLDKHNARISAQRLAMLEELEAAGNYDLYQLVETLVLPITAQLDNKDGGQAFLKIHSQLMTNKGYNEFRRRRDSKHPDMQKFFAMANPLMTTRAPGPMRARMVLVGCLLIHGLSAYLSQADRVDRAEFLHSMTRGIVDILQQPAGPDPT